MSIVSLGWAFVNVYALVGEGGIVLVDAHNPGHGEKIVRRLEREGLDPAAVKAILVTHGHTDHCGSATELAALLPEATLIAAAPDLAVLASGTHAGDLPSTGSRGALVGLLVHTHFPSVVPELVLERELDLAPFGVAATASLVGGHTPGSVVVRTAENDLFVADLIRGGMLAHGKPTLHFFHEDPLAAHVALAEVVRGDERLIYPGHGGPLETAKVERWLERRRPKVDRRWQ